MSSFVGDKKKFNVPVWVKTNENPEIWRIGFLTQKDMSDVGMPRKWRFICRILMPFQAG
jgi:hypothetical protein